MKKLSRTHGPGRSAYKFQTSMSAEEQFLPKSGLSQLLTALVPGKYVGMNPTPGRSVTAALQRGGAARGGWHCFGYHPLTACIGTGFFCSPLVY